MMINCKKDEYGIQERVDAHINEMCHYMELAGLHPTFNKAKVTKI